MGYPHTQVSFSHTESKSLPLKGYCSDHNVAVGILMPLKGISFSVFTLLVMRQKWRGIQSVKLLQQWLPEMLFGTGLTRNMG